MPTKQPRIHLTMSVETLAKVDALASRWGLTRPQAIRRAVKEAAKREAGSNENGPRIAPGPS